jgi:hypothetical protein
MVVHGMAQSISVNDKTRRTAMRSTSRPQTSSEAAPSGNAIVAVAVSAVLWLMIASLVLLWFWT